MFPPQVLCWNCKPTWWCQKINLWQKIGPSVWSAQKRSSKETPSMFYHRRLKWEKSSRNKQVPTRSLPWELCEISCFHSFVSHSCCVVVVTNRDAPQPPALTASSVGLCVLSSPVNPASGLPQSQNTQGFHSRWLSVMLPTWRAFYWHRIYLPWRSWCWSFTHYQVPYLVSFLKFSPCVSQRFLTITL